MACSVDLTITNLVFLGVVVFALKKAIQLYKKWCLEQMLSKWENTPKDKVIMHTVGRGRTIASPSPFALKLETYLRMAKIPYELDTKDKAGPKGKFPWITFNGTHVADSHLIIQFLNKKFSVDLNQKLNDVQISTARACRVMLEEHLFWGMAYYRFIENTSAFFQVMKVPLSVRYMIPLLSYTFRKRMNTQGIGLHTPTEIYQLTGDDLRTASKILGNKKFFGGDEPCEDDCAIFGMVAQALWGLPGSVYESIVNGECSNLKEYCERMKHSCWPDWENCLNK